MAESKQFIEILLIVGGIIGALSDNPLNKVILALFLIFSLLYYLLSDSRSKKVAAIFTSFFFSVLITNPILSGPPVAVGQK